jgi:membrane protease YdiL (CAAX protease family)
MKKVKSYNIFDVNILFFLLGLVFLTFGAYVQSKSFDYGILITEYIIVLLPVLFYGIYKKIDLIEALRLRKIKFKVILKIVGLSIFLVPIIGFGNIITTTLLSYFNLVIYIDMPSAQNGYELVKYSFLIAISAGICEEIFFRGMVLNAYEKHTNRKFALIMSSVLFGLFHFNIQNLLGPMLLGVIFSYLVYITDSILSSIIAHAMNNWVSVFAGYLMNKFGSEISTVTIENVNITTSDMIMSSIFIGLIAIVSLVIIYIFIKSIKRDCLEIKDDMSVIIKGEPYFIVKKKKKGLILINDELNFKELNINNIYNKLIFLDNKNLVDVVIEENLNIHNKNNFKVELYKFFPLFLSLIVYVYFMILVWQSYGLI